MKQKGKKSDNFCNLEVGRVITILTAIEKSHILLFQNWKNEHFESKPKIIDQAKGKTFDHNFCYLILLFFFPYFRREEKRGKDYPKSGSKVMPF